VVIPVVLLLIVADFGGLADLFAISVTSAIVVTTGTCALNKSLPVKMYERLLLGVTTAIVLCTLLPLINDKPSGVRFVLCFVLLGLALLGGRKSRWT